MLKLLILFFMTSLQAQVTTLTLTLTLPSAILDNSQEPFYIHEGMGRYDSTLAMSIRYDEVKNLRPAIEAKIGRNLDYFKGWNPNGEAHITVVTPLEYFDVLKGQLDMSELNEIAQNAEIQSSQINILGLGSAKKTINNKIEETFFLIVDSAKLRDIRFQIWLKFIMKDGDPAAFDPTWFFPHITIGYTLRDLHEDDGVIKNLKHSLDKRFLLNLN